MRTITAAATPLALLLCLSACSSPEPTTESVSLDACDAFAYMLRDGDSTAAGMDRRSTIEQVHSEVDDHLALADPDLLEALTALENAEDGSEGAWTIGADMFVARCTDLGWEP